DHEISFGTKEGLAKELVTESCTVDLDIPDRKWATRIIVPATKNGKSSGPLEVRLQATAAVSGELIDSRTKQPVRGALVVLCRRTGDDSNQGYDAVGLP